MRLEGLLKTLLIAVTAVLAFMAVNSLRMMTEIKDYLISESESSLLDQKDLVEPELKKKFSQLWSDPYGLRDLAASYSLYRVAVVGTDGTVLADSLRPGVYREKSHLGGIGEAGFAEVEQGRTLVTQIYLHGGGAYRSVYFPLRGASGRLEGVGLLTMDVGYIEDLTELGTTQFLMKALVFIIAAVAVLYVFRSFIVSQRRMVQAVKSSGLPSLVRGKPGEDDVSFVIASFQAVVADLKEKEAELRGLKEAAEERARSIESFNESVLRNISSGVVTFGKDGRLLTLNSAASGMLGITQDEARGLTADELFGDGWLTRTVENTLRSGEPVKREEGPYSTGDGPAKWLGGGCSPLRDEEGVLEGAILVVGDLTEVRELRETMELKERMSLLGEMSAGIAHELRNPMAVISGYSRLLASRLAGSDDEVRGAVDEIRAEIAGMDRLIAEFMDFARPTELDKNRLEVGPLVQESLAALEPASEGVEIAVEDLDGLPVVEGDALLLRQAFMNVMKNAFEAMPGGGRLVIRGSVRSYAASAAEGERSGRFVRMDFEDGGTGIPEDIRSRVFTPFFTTKQDGTGLGLALVQKIVTHHGGWCRIDDAPGGGTLFSVYLPAAEQGAIVDG